MTWSEGLLLGAIISSTDAAAVFSVLRTSKLELKGDLQPLLELESGSNDPMAVLLTVQIVEILSTGDTSIIKLVISLFLQIGVGGIFGYGMGRAIVWVVNHLRLNSQGLYPVATLAMAMLTYGITDLFGGNGFLAVYIAGVVMGNFRFIYSETIRSFHDGLSWLMQIVIFLALGLLVFPSRLLPVAGVAIVIAIFLIFIARPVSVFICLAFSRYRLREKLFISWVGLRGSVPIILATFPVTAGIAGGRSIFNVVFFIVLTSVLVQGLSLVPAARCLGLAESN
ncbi:MAG: potassium/proton antiporter [Trichodesmium sp. MO_231.B1]|nr:potassium/proton antiporter [Trichodesmium sp. MO_231.B1]